MPALKEEETAIDPAEWFNGTETAADVLHQQTSTYDLNAADNLAADLEWAFGAHGLDEITDDTLFAAFRNDSLEPAPNSAAVGSTSESGPSNWETLSAPIDLTLNQEECLATDFSWLPEPSTQDVEHSGNFEYDATTASFTIDPLVVMNPHLHEDEQRPLSAPGLNGGEGSGQLLSVPMGSSMMSRK